MTPEQELALIEQVNLHLERAWSLLYRLEKAKNENTVTGFYARLNEKANSISNSLNKRELEILKKN